MPIFGFTRSLGRMAAIKKQFSGIHIFEYRNLWTQWLSWLDHKENKNDYFFRRLLQIIIETENIYLSSILNSHKAGCGQSLRDRDSQILSAALLESLKEENLFVIYMAFHTYFYMCAKQNADFIIDVTRVARDTGYHNQVCSQLECITGLPIQLNDVSEIQRFHSFDPALINWKEIRKNLKLAVSMLDHLFDHEELLRYGMALLNETLAEIEISERYVSTARHHITTLAGERDSAVVARSALAEERDQLAVERDALLAERDRLSAQYGKTTAELDRLTRELAAADVARKDLIAENADLRNEAARAVATVADLAALRLEQIALRTELSRVEAARAQTATQSERWFKAAVVWPSDHDPDAHRLQRDQWFQRLKAWFRASLTGGWIAHTHPRGRTRARANEARDFRQWELAARFYADELNRNLGDAEIWVQFWPHSQSGRETIRGRNCLSRGSDTRPANDRCACVAWSRFEHPR